MSTWACLLPGHRRSACGLGLGVLGDLLAPRLMLGFVSLPPVFVGSAAESSGFSPAEVLAVATMMLP